MINTNNRQTGYTNANNQRSSNYPVRNQNNMQQLPANNNNNKKKEMDENTKLAITAIRVGLFLCGLDFFF